MSASDRLSHAALSRDGQRLRAEERALVGIAARATPPALVSPQIIPAPARGQVDVLRLQEVVMTPHGPVVRAATAPGFHPIRSASPLDADDCPKRLRPSKQADAVVDPLFTDMHRHTARAYATLFERVQSAGIRCSSVEAMSQGGSGGGSFIDAVIADHERLTAMQRAIGAGAVLIPRNAKAHSDRGRTGIRLVDLVHQVCITGLSLSEVLRRHGWSVAGVHRATLREALCAALDRMQRVAPG